MVEARRICFGRVLGVDAPRGVGLVVAAAAAGYVSSDSWTRKGHLT
jgi:hypothetical protein